MKRLLLLLLLLPPSVRAEGPPAASGGVGLPTVTLQLKWKHQFQFAGFYAALEKGYYREAGLDVRIVELGGGQSPVDLVLAGEAEYGVDGSNLLRQYLLGKPLLLLAPIFQHSPAVLVGLKESKIRTPRDLIGKRVMVSPYQDEEVRAMLLKEGLPLDQTTWLKNRYQLEDLTRAGTDMLMVYETNEPYLLEQQRIPYLMLRPIDYGIDFYADMLFTSRAELQRNPRRVAAFRQASLRGWQYALAHPQEMIDLILNRYRPDKSREHLHYEADATRAMIDHELIALGHVNPGRLLQMAETMKVLGELPGVSLPENLDEFLYDEAHPLLSLSADEQLWLKKHQRVRVAVGNLPPLISMVGGEPQGIVVDYLRRVSEVYGIEFDYTARSRGWQADLQGLSAQQGPDLIPALRDTQLGSIDALNGKRVSVVPGSVIEEILRKDYPQLVLVAGESASDCLDLVVTGKVDAYVGNLLIGSLHLREEGQFNLKVAALFPDQNPGHSMGVRSDWPELVTLIDRVLDGMSLAEHNEILQRWLSISYEYGVSQSDLRRWGLWAGLGLLFAGGLVAVWNRSLAAEVHRQKKTEKVMIAAVLRYKQLVHAIPHAVLQVDARGEIGFINRAGTLLLDVTNDELVGRSFYALMESPLQRQQLQEMLAINFYGRFVEEVRVTNVAGEGIPVYLDVAPPEVDSPGEFTLVLTDISIQTEVEEALQRSRNIYQLTFSHVPVGVAHLDTDGNLIRVNEAYARFTGYMPDELTRMNIAQLTHPDDWQSSRNLADSLLARGEGVCNLEKRYLRKDSRVVWGRLSIAILPGSNGERPRFVAVVDDIDDLKRQKLETEQFYQSLEARIAEKTGALQRRIDEVERLNAAMINLADDLNRSNSELALQREQLTEANADLEGFAYSVSHDLRAPLRHISGFVAMLLETSGADLDEKARNLLDRVADSAKRMGEMIDALLTFSRAGRAELIQAPIDMQQLFAEVRAEIDEDYAGRAIRWQIGELPGVCGDVSALRQVVVNLLDNAAKYSAKNAQPVISVSAQLDADEVVFRVRDNGVGFDPACADKLFGVFQRLHRDAEFSGTGIGLASVRRIIARHGGWVEGEALPVEGACFSFALPRKGRDAQ